MEITEILGKSIKLVENILGKADSSEGVSPSRVPQNYKKSIKHVFQGGHIEIVFIDGIADWITINNPQIPFNQDILNYLGLDKNKPVFENNNSIRWTNINAIRSIEAFNVNGYVGYILIKGFQE